METGGLVETPHVSVTTTVLLIAVISKARESTPEPRCHRKSYNSIHVVLGTDKVKKYTIHSLVLQGL